MLECGQGDAVSRRTSGFRTLGDSQGQRRGVKIPQALPWEFSRSPVRKHTPDPV